MNLSSADIYTDFSGLAKLRADARRGEGRTQVAEQVEALFFNMMIKSMRAGVGGGTGGLGGPGAEVRQGLFDSQMALQMARGGRLGFADSLLREVTVPGGERAPGAGRSPGEGFPAPARNLALTARSPGAPSQTSLDVVARTFPAPEVGAPTRASDPRTWDSPEAFARDLWPAATRAAKALGTEPEAVIAVAALETGWGRHMPARADGRPSYNLFGIKAHGWSGDVTHSPTLEFESGAFTRKVEPFRAYDSPERSIEDFARFVKTQPRYANALASGSDPVAFVHALHEAGYATDPGYGDKLERVVGSETLRGLRLASSHPVSPSSSSSFSPLAGNGPGRGA